MKRLKELIQKVITSEKDDGFFNQIEFGPINQPLAYKLYAAYEQALQCLDSESWNILSTKAIEHYRQHRDGQLKEAFYNQLDEAFAYQYLVNQGYKSVKFFEENKKNKTPDLSYRINEKQFYCEVKSIGVSDDEICRSSKSGQDYDACEAYCSLKEGFFKKLKNKFSDANTQLSNYGEGLIFIFIPRFDDVTHMYYSRYREQIIEFITSYEVIEVYFKIGFNGEFIHKKRNGEIVFS